MRPFLADFVGDEYKQIYGDIDSIMINFTSSIIKNGSTFSAPNDFDQHINIIDKNINFDELLDDTNKRIKSYMNGILNTLVLEKSKQKWLDTINKFNNHTDPEEVSLSLSNYMLDKDVNFLGEYNRTPYERIFADDYNKDIKILAYLFDRSNILLYYKKKIYEENVKIIVEILEHIYDSPTRLYIYDNNKIEICIMLEALDVERFKNLGIKCRIEKEDIEKEYIDIIKLFISYNPIDFERIRLSKLCNTSSIIDILEIKDTLNPKNIYHEMMKNYKKELYEMIEKDDILYIESFIDTMMEYPMEHDKLYNFLDRHKSGLDYNLYHNKMYYIMALIIQEQPLVTGNELNNFEKQKILKYLDKAEDYGGAKRLKKQLFFQYLGVGMALLPDFELNNDIDTMYKIAKFFMQK